MRVRIPGLRSFSVAVTPSPFILLIAVVMLISAANYIQNNRAVKTFKLEEPRSKISIRYPVTGCLKADVDIKNFIDLNLNDFIGTLTKPLPPDAPKWQYVFIVDHKKFRAGFNKNIMSVRVEMYRFTGGAHGNTTIFTRTFDKKSNLQISIGDVFRSGSGWVGIVSDIVVKQLSEDLGIYADKKWISEGAGPKKSNFSNFVLSGDEIVFFFPQYQVAPYAAGIQEVAIPVVSISSLLSKKIYPLAGTKRKY